MKESQKRINMNGKKGGRKIMKNRHYIISIFTLCALLFTSCTQREDAIIEGEKVFNASMERPDGTKTVMGEPGDDNIRELLWLSGDAIAITGVGSTKTAMFTNYGEDSSDVATFKGEISDYNEYHAFYPYSFVDRYAAGVYLFRLPSKQTYKPGSFETGMFPMVAVSEGGDNTLNFKNLCGILALNLTGQDTIATIKFSAKDETGNPKVISGLFGVDTDFTEAPTIDYILEVGETAPDRSRHYITFDCGEEGVLLDPSNNTTFYIVLPAGTYNTFSVLITTTDGKILYKEGRKPLNIVRSSSTPTAGLEYAEIEVVDLSLMGTSNSYIVSTPGIYTFDASVIGNGADGIIEDGDFHTADPAISPASAEILWQTIPEPVSNVSYDSYTKKVTLTHLGEKGNAVIAAKDNEGNILWSWHIWCTDEPNSIRYNNDAGIMMDRNLGATTSEPGEISTLGFYYQWGRKDPFLSRADYNSSADAATTITWPTWVTSDATIGTFEYSIQHPTTFIRYNSGNSDWFYGERSFDRWNTVKTIYDPCPPGWKVPDGGPNGIWSKSGIMSSYTFDTNLHGALFEAGNGVTEETWYPAAGRRDPDDGWIYGFNETVQCWSNTVDNQSAYQFKISSSSIEDRGENRLACAYSVRCMKDQRYVNPVLAAVETSAVTDITSSSATIGGKVTSVGASEVTERGVVWGTSRKPTVDGMFKQSQGSGIGEFTCTITDLQEFTTYYVRAYATNEYGTAYSEELSFRTSYSGDVTNLSADGTANCYIVPSAGHYRFNVSVIGNGTEGIIEDASFHTTNPAISPVSVSLLWEDKQGIITYLRYLPDTKEIYIVTSEMEGNALIAAKDGSGTIIWSWHIWSTDQPAIQTYYNHIHKPFEVMDRNIGATRADKGEGDEWMESAGLLYQWGRKDPFTQNAEQATHTVNIQTSIQNPHMKYGYINGWCSTYNPNLWKGEVKTIYDPCPAGYRMSPSDFWTGFTSTGENYDSNDSDSYILRQSEWNNGFDLFYDGESTSWYPKNIDNSNKGGVWLPESRKDSYSYTTYGYAFTYSNSGSDSTGYELGKYDECSTNTYQVRCVIDKVYKNPNIPTVNIIRVANITPNSAQIVCEVTDEGSNAVIERGLLYTTVNQTPTLETSNTTKITSGTGIGEYSINMTDLSARTKYYVRVYATNSTGTSYSEVYTIETGSSGDNEDVNRDDDFEW